MRDKEKNDEMINKSLMRVKTIIERNEVCIMSNSIHIEHVINIYQLWGDAHATVRKYMNWCVPSPVPSIDIDYEYANWPGRKRQAFGKIIDSARALNAWGANPGQPSLRP